MSKTIKEVADILGCSVQAVYNRLEKDFKPYLKIENGKKRIDDKVLEYLNKDNFSNKFSNDLKLNLNLLEKQNEQLIKELDFYKAEITEKNNQISELQKLLGQQQQLTLISENKLLLLDQKETISETKKIHWWQRKK